MAKNKTYVIKNKKTGEYWTGIQDSDDPGYYSVDLQDARVVYEKGLYWLGAHEEYIEVECVLTEVSLG